MPCELHHGECLAVLATLPDASVDSIVTDPPAGIAFMGSGTTGLAAVEAGFGFIGIEKELEYFEIARRRILAPAGPLFGDSVGGVP